MTTSTQTDEELLILSDDLPNDETIILDDSISFDETITDNPEVITFGEDLSIDDLKLDDLKVEESPELYKEDTVLDFSNDFDISDTLESTVSDDSLDIHSDNSIIDEPLESKSIINNELNLDEPLDLSTIEDLSLESDNIETTTVNESTAILWSTATMIDILEETISKLDSRSDTIENEIKTRENEESSLKTQILELEKQAKSKNDEISELKSEKTLTIKNKKSLERMKSLDITSEIKSKTSTKVHNIKRK